ncbi:TPA: PTS transporter subunit EIIC [Enterococcus faecalis]
MSKEAEVIFTSVGEADNIESYSHCATRLRITVKNKNLVDYKTLESLEGVIGVVDSGSQIQVIVGPRVINLYKEFEDVMGKRTNKDIENEISQSSKLDQVINFLSAIFSPIISFLLAAGLIKALAIVLLTSGILSRESGTFIILWGIGNSFFYFLPIVLGYTTANKLKLNVMYGMFLGFILLAPSFTVLLSENSTVQYFNGSLLEMDSYFKVFGVPFFYNDYGQSVIQIIFGVIFAYFIHEKLTKVIPQKIYSLVVPFLVILSSSVILLFFIGPLTSFFGKSLGLLALNLYAFSSTVAGILIGGGWLLFVALGIHWTFVPLIFINYSVFGYDMLSPLGVSSSFAIAGTTLAASLSSKNIEAKELGFSTIITSLLGINEPALYGIILKKRKLLFTACISSAIAGGIAGFFKSKTYIQGTMGILSLPSFIEDDKITNNFVGMVIAMVVAFLLGFSLTYYLYNKKLVHFGKKENNGQQ